MDKDGENTFEIMFFEGLITTLIELQEDQPNYRYLTLFKDNFGPTSQRICRRNSSTWKKLTTSL